MPAMDHVAQNTYLEQFEIAVASDTGAMKIGPGFWNGLPTVGGGVKVYRALIAQTGTAAPVATVLENTLGVSPTWGYSDIGVYNGTIVDATGVAFPVNQTHITISDTSELVGNNTVSAFTCRRIDDNSVRINSALIAPADSTAALSNDVLNASIQILVYP